MFNKTVLSLNGTNNFINNSSYGGAIHMFNKTVLSLNGTNNFINNSSYGGAIHMFNKTVLSLNGTNNFINNSADGVGSGAIYTLNNPLLSFNGANNLIHQQLSKCWLWWSYLHMIYTVLSFNGTSTSSKILQPLVIQLAHQTVYCSYLPSMEPTT